MDFLKKWNLKTATVLKVAGVALLAIVLLAVAFRLVVPTVSDFAQRGGINLSGMPTLGSVKANFEERSLDFGQAAGDAVGLSVRNIMPSPQPPYNGTVTGQDAEQYEVTEFSVAIETGRLDATCQTIADLKDKDYVIFENASACEHGCNYAFKVQKDHVEEILAVLEALDPKELTENTYTIKRVLEDFTSQLEILERKQASIDETLETAIKAYDDITQLATRTQDAESLAKIIESKIYILERLTQERIAVSDQLDYLNRAKAEQLDRLAYTYFNVGVTEDKYIDGDDLQDSWQAAIKKFVQDVNQIAQDITITLVALLLLAFQYALYLLVLLVIAKYGWKWGTYIWKK